MMASTRTYRQNDQSQSVTQRRESESGPSLSLSPSLESSKTGGRPGRIRRKESRRGGTTGRREVEGE